MEVTNKKLVSIYFDELQYMAFQQLSKQQNCNTADLIRAAMDLYLNTQKKRDSFDDWEPLSVGGLKNKKSDWINKDYQDEMLSGSYDWN